MRAARALRDPVARNSLAIMASTVVTSAFGFVFWIIVARLADATTSGIGAAFASGVQLLSVVASVGAAAALVEWLPRAQDDRQWRQLVTIGVAAAAATSLVGGLLVVGSTAVGLPIVPALDTPSAACVFVLAAVLFSIGTVVDYVAVSENRGVVLLVRNTIMCGLRIPFFALLLAPLGGTDAIFLSWAAATAFSVAYGWFAFARRGERAFAPDLGHAREHLWRMRHSLVGQHLITVSAMVPGYLLPLIVVARLDAAQNAYFYVTWMLGSVFFMISPAVSAALFAAVAGGRVDGELVLRSLRLILLLLAAPIVVYLVGGRWLLAVFGPEYAAAGTTLLVMLTLSSIPDAVTNVAVAVLRATGRMAWALTLNVSIAVIVVVGSWITLPRWGIDVVGIWWLVAQAAGAVVVLLTWRRWVGRSASEVAA